MSLKLLYSAKQVKQTVSQLTKLRILLFCHSGLDPWFDRLTTLSKVEGESSAFSNSCVTGCRIKSGMTNSDFLRNCQGYRSALRLGLLFLKK